MMTNYEDRDCDAKEGRSRVEKCVIRDHMILNKKGEDSGVNPSVMDTIDLSKATRKEARRACNSIFSCSFGKYKKIHAFVEFVTRINNRDKIILRIQNQKIWRIAFSLYGVIWPKDETYADEAIELLRTTIFQRWVEVELETIDEDGYFVGYLLQSNNHVVFPVLEAGLAELEDRFPATYCCKLLKAQNNAFEKKLKIWENGHWRYGGDI